MPHPTNDRATRIDVRCAEHERDRWREAANREGLQLSDWIRRTLDRRAEETTTVGPRGGVRRRGQK